MPPAELARLRSIASQAGTERRSLNESTATANAQKKKKKRNLNPVQSILASALPLLAGGAGAALGTIAAPIAGTAAGGALGSAAGEWARQKITGEDTSLGRIGMEGALGSLAGAGKLLGAGKAAITAGRAGKVAKTADAASDAVKAAKTAKTAVTAAKAADTATKAAKTGTVINTARKAKTLSQAEKAATVAAKAATTSADDVAKVVAQKPSLIKRAGMGLTEKGSGLKVGKGVGDINKLDDQAKFMTKFTGTPQQQMRKMDTAMKSASSSVDDVLAKNPVKTDGKSLATNMSKAADDVSNERFIDLDLGDPTARKVYDRYAQKLANATSMKQVNDLVKTINPAATKAQEILMNPVGKTLSAKQAGILAAKRHFDDILKEVPEIKPFKTEMAKLFEVAPDVAKASTKSLGIGPLRSQTVGQLVKGGESRLGSLIQGGRSAANELGQQVAQQGAGGAWRGILGKAVGKQATSRILPAAIGAPFGGFYGGEFNNDQAVEGDGTEELTPRNRQLLEQMQSELDGGDQADPMAPVDESPSSLFSDPDRIERAYTEALMNGDKETATLLLNGLNTFSKVREAATKAKATASGSTSGGMNVSKVTAQNAGNAQAGRESVQKLRSILQEDPGVIGRSATPGRKLPMIGGYIAKAADTADFDAEAYNIVDTILRLRTGAAATDSEVRNLMAGIIPRAGDSPEVVEQKLQLLDSQFNIVLDMAGMGGTSNVDEATEAALAGI